MPTVAGTPISSEGAPSYVADARPVAWLDYGGNQALGVDPRAAQRGRPQPQESWMQRTIRGATVHPFGANWLFHSRPYDRGAQAWAPQFGTIYSNPIGAGIYAPYRLPTIAGPGARYAQGAIWFDVQTIPTGLRFGKSMPMGEVNALVAQSSASAAYGTTG